MAKDSITDVSKILEKYFNDINDDIDRETIIAANKAKQRLRNTSDTYKIRTGKYNKSWNFKINRKYGNIEATVYNAKHYQLTHLLENGHKMIGRDGKVKGFVKAYPHITPTATKISEEYERAIIDIVQNGG